MPVSADAPRALAGAKVVLFDLGGVLVEFVGVEAVRSLMAEDPGPEGARAMWIDSAANKAFETGAISADAFAEAFVREWRIDMAPSDFLAIYAGWTTRLLPGVAELLKDLRPHVRLACLSNTNACHWERMIDGFELGAMLDACYASHLLGVMKPEAEAFRRVTASLDVPPGDVIFFDDGPANVAGAKAAGLRAHRADGPADIRRALGMADLRPR